MAGVSRKEFYQQIDGTPQKRMFLSIMADYDLMTAIAELVDNAIDHWIATGKPQGTKIQLFMDAERQLISVRDNAGGVPVDQIRLLIAPGATRPLNTANLIGNFGVGGKRASVALGEHVTISSRHQDQGSFQIVIDQDWLADEDWRIDVSRVPDLSPGTTQVSISQVRQSFAQSDLDELYKHLEATYAHFVREGCEVVLNGNPVGVTFFNAWAYPPDYSPKQMNFQIMPSDGEALNVKITGGLIRDRIPEADNYGVYFYCNERLILKELKTRDVGYFITSEAGVPHPDGSLCRVIVELDGPADLMPWNSSKNGISFSHPAFTQIRPSIIELVTYFSKLSRRFKSDRQGGVYQYDKGTIDPIHPTSTTAKKRLILPPVKREPKMSYSKELMHLNQGTVARKPWTLGLVEAMGMVDIALDQNFETKNRAALILLDSNVEIGMKEYIINNTAIFPPNKYKGNALTDILTHRTKVLNEVRDALEIDEPTEAKLKYFYALRNKLIHERASVHILDRDIAEYRGMVEQLLRKMFSVRFP
ncbi:Histidine kinase-, DNA gyrase B-, and HSP90-like ATPase [Sulfitobacter litoralis]|uniref:Histidine kinase-, DNA gyrase B-, and HSP90-like ATPase n=1 Tax=Sulfitobacter litoralis TaxID=335975 RepID=A0ABY0RRT9_9RHOB|nr:ATP-binding protein [Sulfitobacter litoralis]SDO40515.1 Histidine kinase-, DNA gyrase B-, and HSP90-like ATPase [Sulfitobacter litoralis]